MKIEKTRIFKFEGKTFIELIFENGKIEIKDYEVYKIENDLHKENEPKKIISKDKEQLPNDSERLGISAILEFLKPFGTTRSTLNKWIMNKSENDFPSYKVGRRVYADRKDLEKWIEKLKKKTR